MFVFSHKLDPTPKYYVYLHRNSSGQIFYVGKGTNKRAWVTVKRTKAWKQEAYFGYSVELLYKNLTEEDAISEEIYWTERMHKAGFPLVNALLGEVCYLSDTVREEVNKRRSATMKKRWQEKQNYRQLAYIGHQNPFWGKRHTKESITKMKAFHNSPIQCMNLVTGEVMCVSGTRNAAELTGIPRQTIMRLLKTGRTIKTKITWDFERLCAV